MLDFGCSNYYPSVPTCFEDAGWSSSKFCFYNKPFTIKFIRRSAPHLCSFWIIDQTYVALNASKTDNLDEAKTLSMV